MFAVVETGGKQLKAMAGQSIVIEKIPGQAGEKVSLKNIVMLVNGKDSKVGNPYVKGAVINGEILEQGKTDKVIVYKMRPKKRYRVKRGHRQHFSKILIENIELEGKIIAKAENVKNLHIPKVKKEEIKVEETPVKASKKTTKKK